MATRQEVYAAIDTEREYQDARRGNSARDDVEDNRDLGSLITLIDVYLDKAKVAFSGPHPRGRENTVEILRKVVGLGVLAMERYGAPKRNLG